MNYLIKPVAVALYRWKLAVIVNMPMKDTPVIVLLLLICVLLLLVVTKYLAKYHLLYATKHCYKITFAFDLNAFEFPNAFAFDSVAAHLHLHLHLIHMLCICIYICI